MPTAKKTIDVVIPVYNEKENVVQICTAVLAVFDAQLQNYDCRILLIDNCSTDGTRALIEQLCAAQPRVRAIFNSRNFGPVRSPFYGIITSHADCTIQMTADFQDPPEMLPEFVRKWEEGNKVVIAIKAASRENPFVYFVRKVYYRLLGHIADIEHISQFTGYGLYDRQVVDALRDMKDPFPYLRGMISEVGFQRAEIPFEQPKRRAGKTKTSFLSLYDVAMLGITSTSKMLLRVATMFGIGIGIISFVIALIYLILKLIFWADFPMGSAPIVIGVFFIGAVQLFFTGILGEYILTINTRVAARPLVIEEKRLNFTGEDAPEAEAEK